MERRLEQVMAPCLLVALLACLLALAQSTAAAAPPPAAAPPLSPAEATVAGAKAAFWIRGDGSFGSLEDTFYAVSSLSVGEKDPLSIVVATCAWLTEQTTNDASSAYHFIATAKILDCPTLTKLIKSAVSVLKKSSGVTSLAEIYATAKGLQIVGEIEKAQFPEAAEKLHSSLQALAQEDGSWKFLAGDSSGSDYAAGLALDAVASLIAIGLPPSSASAATKSAVTALFNRGVSSKDSDGNPIFFFSGSLSAGGPVTTTAAIAAGLLNAASALESSFAVPEARIAALARFLSAAGIPTAPSEAHFLLAAITALDSNQVAIPVELAAPSRVAVGAKTGAILTLRPRSLLGSSVDVGVKLVSIQKKGGKAKTVDVPFSLSSDVSTLSAEILPPAAELGSYILKLEVSPNSARSKLVGGTVILPLQIGSNVKIGDAVVAIYDSDSKKAAEEAKYSLDSASSPKTLSASHLQRIEISLPLTGPSGKLFLPHQALATLTHETGVTHHFLLEAKKDKLSLSINLLESMAKLYYLSGVYTIDLTLGDASMPKAISWNLGFLDLDLPAVPEKARKPPTPPVPLAERFAPLAEIAHIFRKPEKRPPSAVSYAFVGLTLLPLLLLLVGLGSLGVNFKAFPSGGVPLAAAVLFHLGIASILLLYVAFWVQVKLFTALKLLLILSTLTFFPGHQVLSYLANSSAKVKTA